MDLKTVDASPPLPLPEGRGEAEEQRPLPLPKGRGGEEETTTPAPPQRGGENASARPQNGGDEISDLAIDGLVPTTTMRPDSVAAAAADLGRCYEERLAVIPQGGRTQIGLGGVPRRYDVALSTGGLARLLEHEPADLTCRVEAGMRLGDLQAALGKHLSLIHI